MKIGETVRHKKRCGIVKEIYDNGQVYIIVHNGMKPSSDIVDLKELKVISSEEFEAYIKKTGFTSLRGYVK